ncbi:MAG: cadmium-translocating P-type ATPase [Anaerolineales bacterium]|nr:cadmium-translocating P-type ATPase [Anaerolineales bacterium]
MRTLEIPITGMDCAECTQHVQRAIASLPGVIQVDVFLSSEKAIVQLDSGRVKVPDIRTAVTRAGYSVPQADAKTTAARSSLGSFSRRIFTVLGLVFGAVILLVVAGEWLGLLDNLTAFIPFPVGLALVLIGGTPIFLNVVRAALKRQVIAHTLMSIGALAALVVGEWTTALVVVFFMQISSYTERLTTNGARRAVKDLTALAPQTARIEQDGEERDVPIADVRVGDMVVVRPGEKIPVDGEVISGQAVVDQSTVTGESMPVEVIIGSRIFAATLVQQGSCKIRTRAVGTESTFGRVIKLVEEAEAHRADVQQFADKFSAWYLPVVAGIAGLTFLISRNPLATAAVLLVACSCSIAIATPIAMLASIGAGAKRGILIKGGKYLEALAKADVLLIDKTGTLTLGRPQVTDVVALVLTENEILTLAASSERYSEHPLAEAVRSAARERGLALAEVTEFESLAGMGVRARVNGAVITVGRISMLEGVDLPPKAQSLEDEGKTVLFVSSNGELIGLIAAADTLRGEVPAALAKTRELGLRTIELLTGDNERSATAVSLKLGIAHRANLLPQDKIRIVKEYQAQGHVVVMVGDGINDAPALAQANVGIAMGTVGTEIAIEAAHIALMREDWSLVPQVMVTARRTLRVVKSNLGFAAAYNVIGLTLAAFGFLPPILAAALQSLPDLGILGNSARLLKDKML